MKNYMQIILVLTATVFAVNAKAQINTKANGEIYHSSISSPEPVKVYPTQCVNKLMIENDADNLLNYRIINMDGREVSNGALRPKGISSINVSGFPCGLYYICVTGSGAGNTYKFAKM